MDDARWKVSSEGKTERVNWLPETLPVLQGPRIQVGMQDLPLGQLKEEEEEEIFKYYWQNQKGKMFWDESQNTRTFHLSRPIKPKGTYCWVPLLGGCCLALLKQQACSWLWFAPKVSFCQPVVVYHFHRHQLALPTTTSVKRRRRRRRNSNFSILSRHALTSLPCRFLEWVRGTRLAQKPFARNHIIART